jgi:sec-independent protein translocase protein TatA
VGRFASRERDAGPTTLTRVRETHLAEKEQRMFGLSPTQILIVLAVVLLVFGAKRLPEMGRSLGSGLREFKDGISEKSRDA